MIPQDYKNISMYLLYPNAKGLTLRLRLQNDKLSCRAYFYMFYLSYRRKNVATFFQRFTKKIDVVTKYLKNEIQ